MEELVIELSILLTSVGVLGGYAKKWLTSNQIEIMDRLNSIDYNGCKSYLTDFLTEIENGATKSSVQIERAYEVYDHYTKNLNGNSYITTKWKKIMK